MSARIALVGDENPDYPRHRELNAVGRQLGDHVESMWLLVGCQSLCALLHHRGIVADASIMSRDARRRLCHRPRTRAVIACDCARHSSSLRGTSGSFQPGVVLPSALADEAEPVRGPHPQGVGSGPRSVRRRTDRAGCCRRESTASPRYLRPDPLGQALSRRSRHAIQRVIVIMRFRVDVVSVVA